MRNSQYFIILGTIWFAPVGNDETINVIAGGICLLSAGVLYFFEREK